jgi:hypothetical protein
MMNTSNLALEDAAFQPVPMPSRIVATQWHGRTRQQDAESKVALFDVPNRRTIRRCSRLDAVAAFRIVNLEIKTKCERLAARRPTLGQVWELARRIKDQRDLVQQIDGRRALEHTWHLMRQNGRLRNRLVRIAQRWEIDTSILIFE